jgi:hypothetical protein
MKPGAAWRRRAGREVILGFGDVPRLRTLRAVDDLEFDRLTLFQGPEAVATDCGIMDEHVAAAVPLNEPVMRIVLLPSLLGRPAGPLVQVLPTPADELGGTKKDRECFCGLDFYVEGTPLNAALS